MATTTQNVRFDLLAIDRSRSAFTSFKAGLSDTHKAVEGFRKTLNRGLAVGTFLMAINQIKTAIRRDLVDGADQWSKKWEVLIANWTGLFQKSLLSIAMEFDTNFIQPLFKALIAVDDWLRDNMGMPLFKSFSMRELLGDKKLFKDDPGTGKQFDFQKDIIQDLDAQVKLLKVKKETLGQTSGEISKQTTYQRALNEMIAAGHTPTENEITLLKERAGYIGKLTDEIDKLERHQQEMIQIQEMFKDTFVEFGEAIAAGKDIVKSLTDSLKRLSDRLLQMALEKSFDILFGSVQNNQQGVFNLASLLQLLPARAGGGPVTSGQPYLVGERGPELFMPRSSGSIVPNGAGGFNQTVIINDNAGNNVSTQTSPDGRTLEVMIDARTAKNAADPNTQFSRVMNGRGAKPSVKRR